MRIAKLMVLAGVSLFGCSRVDTGSSVGLPPPDVDRPTSQTPSTPAPDNTAVNRRDAEVDTKTPINQDENQGDINLVSEIRKQILDTENLSVMARNAKVIVSQGKVTLRGPVASDAERDKIAQIATNVAGQGNVDNQLEVAAGETATAPLPDRR